MPAKTYETQAAARLAHVRSHLAYYASDKGVAASIHFIETNTGSVPNCLLDLADHALACAVEAWFGQGDLKGLRQWCYVSAKLKEKGYGSRPVDDMQRAPFAQFLDLREVLLSNHPGLIRNAWNRDFAYDLKRAENPKTDTFIAYQGIVALSGDFERLRRRCEHVLENPPGTESLKRYLIDHRFYLALSNGDIAGMEAALQKLVEPGSIRARANFESGFTKELISSFAVIYAKIAWLHGFEVKVDTPYIPKEWLPITPLDRYDNHYAFLD